MKQHSIGRRDFLGAVGGAGLISQFGLGAGLGLAARGAIGQESITGRASIISGRGTELVLLGTQGGPNFRPERKECSTAVAVDGQIYLVDCGYGALGRIGEAGLNHREIAQIFLTHLHDDHTSDVAALLSHQWTGGRIEPTEVIGPYGTERLVNAAIDYFSANTEMRLADEDRSLLPADLFSGRDIEATTTPTQVFADDRVVVSSVENTHFPETAKAKVPYRAVSYRLDSRDRSITISGDTAYSDNLIELAKGSDIFVCEMIETTTTRANFERRVAAGAYAENPEGVWKHIIETHSTPADVGRMAQAAGVATLVLTHILPGAMLDVPENLYIDPVREHFDGEIILGEDLMVI